MNYLWLLIILASCAQMPARKVNKIPQESSELYNFTDLSGEYILKRDQKIQGKKIITRNNILSPMDQQTSLEKTIVVSKMGYLKTNKGNVRVIRPEISQHEIWLDKKRYFSQIKILPKSRSVRVSMESPKKKWNGVKSFDLPGNTKLYCFYSQLPECLKNNNLISSLKKSSKRLNLTLIWDNYPYHNEQYKFVINEPFQVVSLAYDGFSKTHGHKISVDLGNQIIFYHFNKNYDFQRMFWISQGISMVSAQLGE
jgi:hypothetical protein